MEPRRGIFFSFQVSGLVVCASTVCAEQPWRISTPDDLAHEQCPRGPEGHLQVPGGQLHLDHPG
jgi:hypothetical protein